MRRSQKHPETMGLGGFGQRRTQGRLWALIFLLRQGDPEGGRPMLVQKALAEDELGKGQQDGDKRLLHRQGMNKKILTKL